MYSLTHTSWIKDLIKQNEISVEHFCQISSLVSSVYGRVPKKGKGKVQGVPQSQTAALSRHQVEEETDKTKQAQIEQTYIKD